MHSKPDFPVALLPSPDQGAAIAALSGVMLEYDLVTAVQLEWSPALVRSAINLAQSMVSRRARGSILRVDELDFLDHLTDAGLIVTPDRLAAAININAGVA